MITDIFIATMIVVSLVGFDVAHTPKEVVKAQEVTATPTPSPTPLPLVETPETYITKVFGSDAPKAFQLLQDPTCHENLKLDPLAVNDNRTWGGVGRDRGIFQISDVYHPSVTDKCAFDYKCNTDYAYRMFINDGHKFTRWTCGRYLGI